MSHPSVKKMAKKKLKKGKKKGQKKRRKKKWQAQRQHQRKLHCSTQRESKSQKKKIKGEQVEYVNQVM
jgi:hypothetical protein